MSWRRPAITCSRARDPQDRLQVAQPAGAFLHVRLEAVRRVLELRVALAHLEHLRGEERAGVERLVIPHGEALEQRGAADDAARLEQRGLHGDVLRRFLDALRDRAHAAADLEAEIPRHPDEALDARVERRVVRVGQQHEDVDVGVGRELAASVAAHGDERERRGQSAVVPYALERVVGEFRQRVHQRRDVRRAAKALEHVGLGGLEFGAPRQRFGRGGGVSAHGWPFRSGAGRRAGATALRPRRPVARTPGVPACRPIRSAPRSPSR